MKNPERGRTLSMANDWQTQLADSFTHLKDLLQFLQLPGLAEGLSETPFPFRVTRAFAQRMEKGNPNDPLLRQVLPRAAETLVHPDDLDDPVGDLGASPAPGLIQKYQARVLLITTGACAIHCRYCFRRNYPYQTEHLQRESWQTLISHLKENPGVHEVILSGGDPLVLSNERLKALFDRLAAQSQIDTIRLHSRLPVVLPDRIDPGFLKLMETQGPRVVLVTHVNHPNELDETVHDALRRLTLVGVTLLNQSVLLAEINDQAETLIRLSRRLFQMGVLPYYLHELDRARGVRHFEVSNGHSVALIDQLRRALPGYLVPRLVREVPGAPFKVPTDRP